MKRNRTFAVISGMLGILLAVGVVFAAFTAPQVQPKLLKVSDEAVELAGAMMEAACSGDYEEAGNRMLGKPNLGKIPEDASIAAQMIWDAFIDSLEYDFPDGCYASDRGLTMDVHIRSLDISSVTAGVKKRVEKLVNRRVEAAEDISEVYDEKNNYRDDLVLSVLEEATSLALKKDARYVETIIPLQLTYEQGQWWVQPSQELLNVLSGVGSGR